MKRILCICLPAAVWACSLFEPDDPGFGALTGDWEAWCCPGVLDASAEWHLRIVEEPTGDIAGTVVRTEHRAFPTPGSTAYTGTVTGRHRGSDIVLVFSYENWDRHRFEGKQTSETTFRGADESWYGYTREFVRVADPP